MTCLYVVGLLYSSFCFEGAPPIGICNKVDDHMAYCTVDFQELPIKASWYDPAQGGINCYLDTCDHLGDGTLVTDAYGWAMACPLGMYGLTLDIEHAGQWQCRDHGGAVNVRYGEVYTSDGWVTEWHIVGDFLLQAPEWWTYDLLEFEVMR